MRLPELIEGLPISGDSDSKGWMDTEVLGIAHDSRRVQPGDLFVAWRGETFDGRAFVSQAMENGAVAILAAEPPSSPIAVPCLVADQPHSLLGSLAARVYEHPDRRLRLIGVTGTNGKTTVATLIASMLEAEGRPTACLGTLGYRFRRRRLAGERTTPEASDLFCFLRQSFDDGASDVVMEVSSHALAQGRVASARFDLGVFLNLSRDHLDFHADLEDYFEEKAGLFELLKEDSRAVVNLGDAYGRRLAVRLPAALTFGDDGLVRYDRLEIGAGGIVGKIVTPRFEVCCQSPLLGPYNAENILAATAAGEALGLSCAAIERAISRQEPLEGRMQAVEAGQPFPVIVDFAHTGAALEAALQAMRSLGDSKVLVVFGCGGGRDRGKRELMGRVAAEHADYSILTSDNPRDEDPRVILQEVEAGLKWCPRARYEVIEDRRQAIRRAVEMATPEWSILIAGKGHEKVQIVGSQRLPFVDREEAAEALEERFGSASNR